MRTVTSLASAMVLLVGCAAQLAATPRAAGIEAQPANVAAPMAPLDHSLFARDPGGQLTEEKLQQILDAPIEVQLPARIGVLPIIAATDWRGPSPSYSVQIGAIALARSLRGGPFSMVTEMMPIPSGALGMEALRETAARYRLRYLVLYREAIDTDTRANGWAAGYATLVGAFFLPGETLRAAGFIEVSVFDVKTGTLMFTQRRSMLKERISNVWHSDDKLAALAADIAQVLAPQLAEDLRLQMVRYAEATKAEGATKVASLAKR